MKYILVGKDKENEVFLYEKVFCLVKKTVVECLSKLQKVCRG